MLLCLFCGPSVTMRSALLQIQLIWCPAYGWCGVMACHLLHSNRTRTLTLCYWAAQGFVYVKFATVTAAEAAQKALHGRWFAGKQVCAEFQLAAMYRQHFGE